jgi:hypothetical protein
VESRVSNHLNEGNRRWIELLPCTEDIVGCGVDCCWVRGRQNEVASELVAVLVMGKLAATSTRVADSCFRVVVVFARQGTAALVKCWRQEV